MDGLKPHGPEVARPEGRLVWLLRFSPAAASVAAAIVGSLVLLGWRLDIEIFKSVLPGLVSMNPSTAVALILSGLSLSLLRGNPTGRWRRRIGRVCALAVGCIGSLRLLGYVAGWDRGVDTLLFTDKLELQASSLWNRMAPNTALVCILVGASLMLLDVRTSRGRRPSYYLTLTALIITLFALVGYGYGVAHLYGLSAYIPMALPTAATFTVLCLGILCARPGEGLVGVMTSDAVGGHMARRLMPAVIGIPLLLGWTRLAGERAGLFDTPTGVALHVVAVIVVLATLVQSSAAALNRADAERRRAEERTQGAQAFLDSVVENIPNMIFVKAAEDLRFVRFNRAGEELLGYSREELIGKNDHDFFPKEEADFFTERDRHVLESKQLLDVPEEPVDTRHRGTRILHTRKAPILDAEGTPRYLLGISEDITERKRIEEQMAKTVKALVDLKAALDHHAIVAIVDARGKITSVNDKFCGISKYSREELLGQDHRIINSGYHPRTFMRDLWQTITCGSVWHGEIKNRAKDGTFYWVDTTIVPYLDEQGKPFQYIAIRADITARKLREEEVGRLNADLSQQSIALEAANKELEAFSYSVSHDLRAPLRHASGFAELLERHAGSTLDETGRRYLGTISSSASQMGELIDDLLAFSRMGRAEMRSARVPLEQLVAETLKGVQEEVEGRCIVWKVGSLPEVQGDPAMLRLVFANLISNAVKHTRIRPESLIEIGAEMRGGETVVFVRDNGAGFDMQYAHKLFGVFQRLHAADEFEGTGIGLANVRRIIHRHGGRTWAEGEVDRGATFYFSLPEHQRVGDERVEANLACRR